MSLQRIQRLACIFTLAVALAAIGGCGESTGTVKGKVYFKEEPLTEGSVAFMPPNEKVVTAPIQSDGSYEIPRVSTGVAKITVAVPQKVVVPAGKMMDPGKMGAKDKGAPAAPTAGKSVDLPAKFGDVQKSGLTYTVTSGSQNFDIKLQP